MLRSMKEQDYGEIRCFKNFVRKVHLEMKIKNIHPTSAHLSDKAHEVCIVTEHLRKQFGHLAPTRTLEIAFFMKK